MSWNELELSDSLKEKILTFKLSRPLGFGSQVAPVVVRSVYEDGQWSALKLCPLEDLSYSPLITSLHYGQSIFEGMKAYFQNEAGPYLFRPEKNAQRFADSAKRMAMAVVPETLFLDAVYNLVHHLKAQLPTGEGETLYLRPLLFASEEGFFLRPSGKYEFLVMACPSSEYFATDKVAALIDRSDCRAAPGGTGLVKAAGNYGGSFRSGLKAKSLGFQQTLWLDAIEKKYIEEFSGMNMFALIKDELVTPELTDTILPGITRDAIMTIARSEGIRVTAKKLAIDELISQIKEGTCTEIFACGTAAVISPIAELGEADGTRYSLPYSHQNLLWKRLRTSLTNLQTGVSEDQWDFRKKVAQE